MKRIVFGIAALLFSSAPALATGCGDYCYKDFGNYNSSYVLQEGLGNYALNDQNGDYNKNQDIQHGKKNVNGTFQNGWFNTELNYQIGVGNLSVSWQEGVLNTGVHVQRGYKNRSLIVQKGAGNTAANFQSGYNGPTKWRYHTSTPDAPYVDARPIHYDPKLYNVSYRAPYLRK